MPVKTKTNDPETLFMQLHFHKGCVIRKKRRGVHRVGPAMGPGGRCPQTYTRYTCPFQGRGRTAKTSQINLNLSNSVGSEITSSVC